MTGSAQRLTLFVTGDAPRSQRARANLARVLAANGGAITEVAEVDLLSAPQQGLDHGIIASPALMLTPPEGAASTLYGDLSDAHRLSRFLGLGRDLDVPAPGQDG